MGVGGSPPPPAFKIVPKPKLSQPAKRLKPFFWNKVGNNNVAATVWNDVPESLAFDLGDLEATFTINNDQVSSSHVLSSPTMKQNVTTLLDITRANNIGKLLRGVIQQVLTLY